MKRVGVIASRDPIEPPEAVAAAHRFGRSLGHQRALVVVLGPLTGSTGALIDATVGVGGRGLVVSQVPIDASEGVEARIVATEEAAQSEIADRVDAFVVLPGAVASLDQALAPWSWSPGHAAMQPLGLWDADGVFTRLLQHASDEAVDRFARESQRGQLIMSRDPDDLIRRLADYRPPETRRHTQTFDE